MHMDWAHHCLCSKTSMSSRRHLGRQDAPTYMPYAPRAMMNTGGVPDAGGHFLRGAFVAVATTATLTSDACLCMHARTAAQPICGEARVPGRAPAHAPHPTMPCMMVPWAGLCVGNLAHGVHRVHIQRCHHATHGEHVACTGSQQAAPCTVQSQIHITHL